MNKTQWLWLFVLIAGVFLSVVAYQSGANALIHAVAGYGVGSGVVGLVKNRR